VVELTAEKRKLYTDQSHDLRSWPNTIRVITSRKMRWVVRMASMGQKRGT